MRQMLFNGSAIRHAGLFLAISLAALPVAGCKSLSFNDLTGSISRDEVPPNDPAGLRRFTESWGKRYESNPNDRQVILVYARGLRAEGKFSQAVAVLQQAAMRAPNDLEILGAYGKALADAGRLDEAAGVRRQSVHCRRHHAAEKSEDGFDWQDFWRDQSNCPRQNRCAHQRGNDSRAGKPETVDGAAWLRPRILSM